MKLIVTSCFALIFALASIAQNYSISNVQFDHNDGDTLLPGEFVNITYDYTKTGGDIRITCRPYISSGPGTSLMSGYALKTDDVGSGDARFSYKNGKKVESIKFSFVDLDWTGLYDTIIPVDFHFHTFLINDLQISPVSPSVLGIGDSLKLDFGFNKTYGDVKIIPIALSNGSSVHKQTTPILPIQSRDTGIFSTFIKIDTLATVDQIMFQFLDASTNDTLNEITYDVYFTFTNDISQQYSITNVVCNPPSPGNIGLNEQVDITFNYTKPYGDVRIYVDPVVSEGSSNVGTGGSTLYTENSATGTGRFVFYDEAKVEKLVFRIKSPSGIILYEYFEDVFFTITADSTLDYSISDVEFTPPSPGNLNTGDTIHVKFNYTKPFGEVNFFIHPLNQNIVVPGYEIPNLGAFSADSGTVETYIIYDIEASFDQLSIKMNSGPFTLLFEHIVNAEFNYTAVPFNISELNITPTSPDSINIRDSININFIYKNLAEKAKVIVTPIANGQELTEFDSSNDIELVNNSGMVKAFIRFNDIIEIDQIKLQILSDNGTKSTISSVIYEQLISVDFVFKIPTSSELIILGEQASIYPNPTEGILKISVPANNFNYKIVTLSGQVVLVGNSIQNNKTINISSFESGIYFVKIKYGEKQFSKKVIFK